MKNEFLDFLSSREMPPMELEVLTKKEIQLSFRGKSIFWRFIFFQLLGALFSLSVCPQFGLGLVEGHGITHVFRLIGDWACALFCGSVFLGSGLLVAFLGMPGEEIWWLWRRARIELLILPSFLWGMLMTLNLSWDLPNESLSYHVIWVLSAVLAQGVLILLRKKYFEVKLLRV